MSRPSTEPIAERAAADLGLARDGVELRPGQELAGSTCVVHPVVEVAALDAQPEHYVQLGDGTIVGGRAAGVAEAVLDHCFGDGLPTAVAVADVVLTFTTTPGPIQILGAGWARRSLEAAGIENRPPTLVESDDGWVVTFLTQDLESATVGRATVSRTDGGPLRVGIEDI